METATNLHTSTLYIYISHSADYLAFIVKIVVSIYSGKSVLASVPDAPSG